MKLKVLTLIFLITHLLASEQSEFRLIETNLTNNLFDSYKKDIRPNSTVNINVTISLKQIINLDEKNQILTTSSFLFVKWYDSMLSWNSSLFKCEYLSVNAKKIWLPDLYVTNSANSQRALLTMSDSSLVWIRYDGFISATYELIGLTTLCDVDSFKFPFDTQNCSINISSWQYNNEQIILTTDYASNRKMRNYIPSQLWEFESITAKISESESRLLLENEKFSLQKEIDFRIAFKRRSSYYIINNIFPCIVLNAVTLLLFALPFNLQASLSMTSFLTQTVFSVRISSDLPSQTKSFPLISLYFFSNLINTFLALIWFIFLNYLSSKKYLPKFLVREKKEKIQIKQNQVEAVQQVVIDCSKSENNENFEQELKKLNLLGFLVLLVITLTSNLLIWIALSN